MTPDEAIAGIVTKLREELRDNPIKVRAYERVGDDATLDLESLSRESTALGELTERLVARVFHGVIDYIEARVRADLRVRITEGIPVTVEVPTASTTGGGVVAAEGQTTASRDCEVSWAGDPTP